MVRVDFGRVFPGLLIFLIGLGFFAFWIVLVFVSFFAFFVPPLHGIFGFALGILAASVVLMVAGGLLAFSGVSGWGGPEPWRREPRGGGWWERVAAKRAARDELAPGERFGQLVSAAFLFLIGLFFVENQVRGTGFFTSAFKAPEEFLFYGPWVVGMALAVAKAAYGRKNALRPADVVDSLFTVVAAFALLATFPFDFSHLPALLPESVRFLFWWVNDQVGALVLLLTGVGSLASVAYTSVLYAVVRSEIRRGLPGAG